MLEFLLLLLFIPLTVPALYAFTTGIAYVPSSSKALQEIETYVQFPAGSVVYDLGTGDGKLLFALLGKKTDVRGYGFELFWPVYVIAKLRSMGTPHIRIHFRDMYRVDYTNVTHVVCFLHTKPLTRLRKIWETSLRPGTIVASHMFRVPGWEEKELHRERTQKHVFFYKV